MCMHRKRLTIGIGRALFGTAALGFGVVAWAGDLPRDDARDQAEPDAAPRQDAKPKPAAPTPTKLGQVVVTAQSRSQEVQDVPIPLQIVDAAQIDTLAATDLSRMDLFVPGLVVGAGQPTQPRYELRGISTSDFGVGTESAVGVYIDGVYAARSGGALLAFNDVKRIEVLKGPQGTLFGRNAAAGAISIVTNEPSGRFEARARVRVGNQGRRYVDGLLNLPAGEDMAFRFSAIQNRSDGWIRDAGSGRRYGRDHDWGTRAGWRWNVTDNTRVLLTWDHEELDQPPQPSIGLIAMPADPQARPPFPPDPATYLDPLHAPLYNDAVGGAETRRFDGVTLNIDHAFGWGSLTSITALRDFDTFNRGDYDGTDRRVTYLDTTNIESNRSWYQEFKFAGTTDLTDWVAGVSGYRESADQTSETNIFTDSLDTLAANVMGVGTPLTDISNALAAAGVPVSLLGDPWGEAIDNHGTFKAYAAYGDVIWHLNDRLNLTTGARFTRDEKTFSWYNRPRRADQFDYTVGLLGQNGILAMLPPEAQYALAALDGNLIFTDAVGVPVQFHDTWNDFSPRAVLDYRFTPDVMGYVSVARGYKAGGYNSVQVGSRFEPEKVWNYEAGIKSVFPEHDLLLNASVYHYKYDNRQSLSLDPNTAGSGVPRYLVNSSDQKADGLELELQWQPLEALRVHFNGAYIDARYGHKITASGHDVSGQPTGEPRYSFAAGLAYTWHRVAGGDLQFDLEHGYRGASRCNADSKLQGSCQISPNFQVGEARNRTDARLDWSASGGHWGVALYVNNLFDHRYVEGVDNISASVFGTPFAHVTPPRTWGLELRARY